MPATDRSESDHRTAPSRHARPAPAPAPTRVRTVRSHQAGLAERHEHRAGGLRSALPFMAGVAYLVSWVAGLLVFSSSTQVRSTGEQVVSTYAGHTAVVTIQFVLTEGVTAVLLAVVLWRLGVLVGGRLGRTIRLTGLAAAAISIAECGLGVILATRIVSRHDPDAAGAAYDLLNRLDGAKMLLLGVSAGATSLAIGRARAPLPSWLAAVSIATCAAIAVSGIGYLALDDALAAAAYLSLPLLIAFVTGSAVCLGRSRVPSAAASRTVDRTS